MSDEFQAEAKYEHESTVMVWRESDVVPPSPIPPNDDVGWMLLSTIDSKVLRDGVRAEVLCTWRRRLTAPRPGAKPAKSKGKKKVDEPVEPKDPWAQSVCCGEPPVRERGTPCLSSSRSSLTIGGREVSAYLEHMGGMASISVEPDCPGVVSKPPTISDMTFEMDMIVKGVDRLADGDMVKVRLYNEKPKECGVRGVNRIF